MSRNTVIHFFDKLAGQVCIGMAFIKSDLTTWMGKVSPWSLMDFLIELCSANGVTECPISPGQSKTYKFILNSHGTAWYHSHFSGQYGDGVLGPIIINGPSSANYDIDLGAFPITDIFDVSTWEGVNLAATSAPPPASNGLVNGTMVSPDGSAGYYNRAVLQKNKKYRLRLINTGLDNMFKVSLDAHKLKVIQADLVPIIPYDTEWLSIAVGQRYDVIITADQDIASYWFRAEAQRGCGFIGDTGGKIRAIFSYESSTQLIPSSKATNFTVGCEDESLLVPIFSKDVPTKNFYSIANHLALDTPVPENVTHHGRQGSTTKTVFFWKMNGGNINVDWEHPTLEYVGTDNKSLPASFNVIELPEQNTVRRICRVSK